ncbi:hypothetical protein [Humibacillus sp. DSM 29435]|uniref:hypothetical protein n=1 Tax=Humibacillus sp. DSM 29435 TaxID=1869167 RepID=UPI00111304BB|nr:hypothetical protein [Humibacillus sp. DSM 29435]
MGHSLVRGSRLTTVVIAVGVLSACSSPGVKLPDRADHTIQREEARLAAVIGAQTPTILGALGTCSVRLLRQDATASFVWAECGTGPPINSGVSAPMRVIGSDVTVPRDGTQYTKDIHTLFPDDLAEIIEEQDDTIRP